MRILLALALLFGFIGLPLMAGDPAAPVNEGAVSGFTGTLTGTVLTVGKNGAWFTLKIVSAEGPEAPPADAEASITCKPKDKAQAEWAKKLKPKNSVVVKVKAGDQRKLMLEAPGKKA